ncbi:hypothetical protein KUTeg_005926, partial [Tegillarca granosa]
PLTSVTINSQSITVIEERTSEVTCTTSDSVPAANVTWYILRQGSQLVQLTNGIIYIQKNKKTINKPSNIRIAPVYDPYIVYVTQTGVKLQCTTYVGNPPSIAYTWSHNGVNTSNNPYVITVTKTSGDGPEIKPFAKQQPVEGSVFVLSCNVSGKPAPTSQQIWWTRQNDHTFRQQGNQLVIDKIQKGQSGIYRCHAQNTLTPSGQSSINKTATQDVEVDVLYSSSGYHTNDLNTSILGTMKSCHLFRSTLVGIPTMNSASIDTIACIMYFFYISMLKALGRSILPGRIVPVACGPFLNRFGAAE